MKTCKPTSPLWTLQQYHGHGQAEGYSQEISGLCLSGNVLKLLSPFPLVDRRILGGIESEVGAEASNPVEPVRQLRAAIDARFGVERPDGAVPDRPILQRIEIVSGLRRPNATADGEIAVRRNTRTSARTNPMPDSMGVAVQTNRSDDPARRNKRPPCLLRHRRPRGEARGGETAHTYQDQSSNSRHPVGSASGICVAQENAPLPLRFSGPS